MRKILLSIGIAILVLGLGMQSGLVHTEKARAEARPLSAAEAAAIQEKINVLKASVANLEAQIAARRNLKQALNVTAVLVLQIKNKLKDPNIAARQKTAISAGLMGIGTRLLAVRDSLSAPLASAPIAIMPPKPPVSAAPVVAESPEEVKIPEIPPAVIASQPSAPAEDIPALKETASREKETASLSGKFDWYKPIGVILVLAGIITLVLWHRKKEEVAVVPQSPQF